MDRVRKARVEAFQFALRELAEACRARATEVARQRWTRATLDARIDPETDSPCTGPTAGPKGPACRSPPTT